MMGGRLKAAALWSRIIPGLACAVFIACVTTVSAGAGGLQSGEDTSAFVKATAKTLLSRGSAVATKKGSVKQEIKSPKEGLGSQEAHIAGALFALPEIGRDYRLTITSEAIGRAFVTQRILVPTAYLLDKDFNLLKTVAEPEFKEAWKRVTIKRYLLKHTLTMDSALRGATHLLVLGHNTEGLAAVVGGSTGIVTLTNVGVPRSAEGKIEVKIE